MVTKPFLLPELGELELIRRLDALISSTLPSGVAGVGDDCAVLPASYLFASDSNESLLVTTDAMIDGVHFDLAYTTPGDLGWKLLAVSLSDIAAMGGEPRAAVVSLQLPSDCSVEWLEDLYRGMRELAQCYSVSIVGGDTVSSRTLGLSLTLLGATTFKPIMRSSAQPGDELWVSGEIGWAAAGLASFQGHLVGSEQNAQRCRAALLRPGPRVAFGRYLAQHNLASAMIDISDGLLRDVEHIAVSSSVACELDLASIPFAEIIAADDSSYAHAMCGGEDYELLFAAPPQACSTLEGLGASMTAAPVKIGRVVVGEPEVLLCEAGAEPLAHRAWLERCGYNAQSGYEHFRS